MRAVTLTDLRSRVRRRADVENEIERHPDVNVDDDINEGIAAFHSEVVRADGQGVLEGTTIFMTAANVDTYSLPAQFLQLRAATIFHDSREYDLRQFDVIDASVLSAMSGWLDGGIAYYRLYGDNIILKPTPTSAKRVTLKYVGSAVKLTAPSNTLDGIDGFEEYVVAWAAQRIAFKDENWDLLDRLENVKGEQLDKLRAIVSNRDDFEPARFQDGARNQRGRGGRWGWGRWR
jgi:hypothetical protein